MIRAWPGRGMLAATVLCSACASVAPPPSTQISGRLTVQVAPHAGQPARGVNAAFDLQGNADAGELRLSTPLGPQMAAARWAPGEALLVTGDGQKAYPDLASLAHDALGESLPLQALPDWLSGRPWPGAPSETHAAGFSQLGWTIDLAGWAQGFVSARRAGEPAVTLRVRLEQP